MKKLFILSFLTTCSLYSANREITGAQAVFDERIIRLDMKILAGRMAEIEKRLFINPEDPKKAELTSAYQALEKEMDNIEKPLKEKRHREALLEELPLSIEQVKSMINQLTILIGEETNKDNRASLEQVKKASSKSLADLEERLAELTK